MPPPLGLGLALALPVRWTPNTPTQRALRLIRAPPQRPPNYASRPSDFRSPPSSSSSSASACSWHNPHFAHSLVVCSHFCSVQTDVAVRGSFSAFDFIKADTSAAAGGSGGGGDGVWWGHQLVTGSSSGAVCVWGSDGRQLLQWSTASAAAASSDEHSSTQSGSGSSSEQITAVECTRAGVIMIGGSAALLHRYVFQRVTDTHSLTHALTYSLSSHLYCFADCCLGLCSHLRTNGPV
jgi:hypothetical protein